MQGLALPADQAFKVIVTRWNLNNGNVHLRCSLLNGKVALLRQDLVEELITFLGVGQLHLEGDLLVRTEETLVTFSEELRQQLQVESFLLHVQIDLIDQLVWVSVVKLIPALDEIDVVPLTGTFLEKVERVLEVHLLDEQLERLVSQDHVRNSCLHVIHKLWSA